MQRSNIRRRRRNSNSPRAISEQWDDDFETNELSKWPVSTNVVTSAAAKKNGDYGARFSLSASSAVLTTQNGKWNQELYPWALAKFWVVFRTLPASGTGDVITLENVPQSGNAQLIYHSTAQWRYEIGGMSQLTGNTPVVDTWQYCQFLAYYGSDVFKTRLKIDDTLYDWVEDTGNTATYIRAVKIGTFSSKTYGFDIDDLETTLSTKQPAFS